ncbi:PhzF family phenazine biosynthesis protein [Schnuerera sp. xch1]|uniref:PhzF family phenazine biosynthesis protein n=1 Tax=Schnuerera sp. xch1 TaxID=2874283 RepID=UPI001CBF8E7C|nr:PhzF family phenazine biosynthesis protein [Schnuerera sp. xch1]MBZ2175688.1 PhzF family phenazine biosynthesis protein [Schnuerera sp. xch1]
MQVNIYQVDAFSSAYFGGNPTGVVPDARGISEEDMQNIAREMNLSETAFIIAIDKNNYKVRFFTPINEVDLCGHATIGAFYTLAYKGYISSAYKGVKKIYQETNAGKLQVEIFFKDGNIEKVMMQQSTPKDLGKVKDIYTLLSCFNINKNDIGIGEQFADPKIISTGLPDILLPINTREKLDNLKVDFNKLADISRKLNVTGVHAFYLPEFDSDQVYTRNFAPLVGINEEAATGTANGALIYYLKDEGYIKRNDIVSIQGESLNRPSKIYCVISKKNEEYNVKVGGQAKIVLEGIICF